MRLLRFNRLQCFRLTFRSSERVRREEGATFDARGCATFDARAIPRVKPRTGTVIIYAINVQLY